MAEATNLAIEFEWDAAKAKANYSKHGVSFTEATDAFYDPLSVTISDEQVMKKDDDVMRPQYDFSKGVRGKYSQRLAKGANVVVLDNDVAKIFPTSNAVNDAMRLLAKVGKLYGKPRSTGRTARPRD